MHTCSSLLPLLAAFGVAFLAGAINSVAGGGTMLSFPALIALGLPPIIANATSTVGIWPGSLGSIWGFRIELARVKSRLYWLGLPALIGGVAGAWLLKFTPPGLFNRMVPWLILFATVLFMVQAQVQRRLKSVQAARHAGPKWLTLAMVLQIGVAIYGGYFGAGMSIMVLAVLGLLGMTDLMEMNGIKSLLTCAINGSAAILFACTSLVNWPFALAMTTGALAGGWGAAGAARKIGNRAIRRFVIFVGLAISLWMFIRVFWG